MTRKKSRSKFLVFFFVLSLLICCGAPTYAYYKIFGQPLAKIDTSSPLLASPEAITSPSEEEVASPEPSDSPSYEPSASPSHSPSSSPKSSPSSRPSPSKADAPITSVPINLITACKWAHPGAVQWIYTNPDPAWAAYSIACTDASGTVLGGFEDGSGHTLAEWCSEPAHTQGVSGLTEARPLNPAEPKSWVCQQPN